MIVYTTSETDDEFRQILSLQQKNLPINLTAEQVKSQGFVTIRHNIDLLRQLRLNEPNIIAKDGDRVAGYILAMTVEMKYVMPILLSMFEAYDRIEYNGRVISSYQYIVVGQVCIAESYRGKNVFENCYYEYRKHFCKRYDFAIAEISVLNNRSKAAHKKIGFRSIHSYVDQGGDAWDVLLWNWK